MKFIINTLTIIILSSIIFVGYQVVVKNKTVEEAGEIIAQMIDKAEMDITTIYRKNNTSKMNNKSQHEQAEEYFIQANNYYKEMEINDDTAKAISLYKKSAELGNERAELALASIYVSESKYRDFDKAFKIYKKYAEKGNSSVQLPLAMIYVGDSEFTKKYRDTEKSLFWIEKSVENKNPDATLILANWYEHGYIVEQNLMESFKLYHRARDYGDKSHEQAGTIAGIRVMEKMEKASGVDFGKAMLGIPQGLELNQDW